MVVAEAEAGSSSGAPLVTLRGHRVLHSERTDRARKLVVATGADCPICCWDTTPVRRQKIWNPEAWAAPQENVSTVRDKAANTTSCSLRKLCGSSLSTSSGLAPSFGPIGQKLVSRQIDLLTHDRVRTSRVARFTHDRAAGRSQHIAPSLPHVSLGVKLFFVLRSPILGLAVPAEQRLAESCACTIYRFTDGQIGRASRADRLRGAAFRSAVGHSPNELTQNTSGAIKDTECRWKLALKGTGSWHDRSSAFAIMNRREMKYFLRESRRVTFDNPSKIVLPRRIAANNGLY